jgi:hypothetical protein
MIMIPAGLGPENDCAGETNNCKRERGCYIRTINSNVSWKIKLLVVSLKELVAKTN